MLFKEGRFLPSGIAEYLKLSCTVLSSVAQVGLNVALSVIIGISFRSRGPWAFFLAISLAGAWAIALMFFLGAYLKLTKFLNRHQVALKNSRSALVRPVGAESLAAALGSAFLTSATLWIANTARHSTEGLSDQDRYGQFDIYFPITIGFQILALPGFVKLADIFGYAEAKAKRELENIRGRSEFPKKKQDLNSTSSRGSLISAESIRAAQKELDQAKARLERRERNLASVSTGASAQSLGQPRTYGRTLIPMVLEKSDKKDREERLRQEALDQEAVQAEQGQASILNRMGSAENPTTRVDMFSNGAPKRSWF